MKSQKHRILLPQSVNSRARRLALRALANEVREVQRMIPTGDPELILGLLARIEKRVNAG